MQRTVTGLRGPRLKFHVRGYSPGGEEGGVGGEGGAGIVEVEGVEVLQTSRHNGKLKAEGPLNEWF